MPYTAHIGQSAIIFVESPDICRIRSPAIVHFHIAGLVWLVQPIFGIDDSLVQSVEEILNLLQSSFLHHHVPGVSVSL